MEDVVECDWVLRLENLGFDLLARLFQICTLVLDLFHLFVGEHEAAHSRATLEIRIHIVFQHE